MRREIEKRDGANSPQQRNSGDAVRDACDALPVPIPRAHRGIAGKHAKALLEDGFEYDMVVLAVVIGFRRGSPQFVQYIASDLAMAQGGKRISRRDYERRLQDEVELNGRT